MKTCTKCKQTKELSEFNTDKTTTSGYRGGCKICLAIACKIRKEIKISNETQLEKEIRLQKRRDKIINETPTQRDARLQSKRELRNRTVNARLEYSRKYTKENKDKIKEWAQYERGKLSNAKKAHKRRVKMLDTDDKTITIDSLEALREQQGHKCVYCACNLDYKRNRAVHLDHIKPLSKGGTHTLDNVQWLCSICNQHKSANIIN